MIKYTGNLDNDVAKFLDKTRKTIYNYVKEDKFVEDKHYYTNEKGHPTFIPSGIIEFKKGVKAVDTKSVKKVLEKPIERVNNPIVSNMLIGVS